MSELTGQVIGGRYRVDAFCGKGGMAEVYKVWDQNRSVFLAMKILHADLAEDKVFVRRFRREAQTLAKLQHPNIVRFYGLEQADNLVFILMDFVEGTTLRKEIYQARGPFSAQRILEVMRPICAALHYAHQSGIAHCDVKPANVMIHTNGTILLADFGIARMTEASTATMVGAGTPAYMAPEQIRGGDPTPQTDIYALGVILYEMMSGGERPFTGENARTTGSTSEKIRWEQLNLDPPSMQAYNIKAAPALWAIVTRCLQKEPMRRFSTITELLTELMKACSAAVPAPAVKPRAPTPTAPVPAETTPAVPRVAAESAGAVPAGTSPHRRKIRPLAWILPVAAVALVGGGAWYLLSQAPPSTPVAQSTPMPPTSAFVPASLPSATRAAPTVTPLRTSTAAPPAASPTQALQVRITAPQVFMRSGPGTIYPEVTTKRYTSGSVVTIIARNAAADWFLATDSGRRGWLYFEWIGRLSNPRAIPLASVIPTPPPTVTKAPKETYP